METFIHLVSSEIPPAHWQKALSKSLAPGIVNSLFGWNILGFKNNTQIILEFKII